MTITVRLNLRSELESSLTRVDGLLIAKLRKAEFVYLCNCIFVFVYLCVFACCKIEEGGVCVFVFVQLHNCICVFDGLPVAKLRKAEIVFEAQNSTTKCILSQSPA